MFVLVAWAWLFCRFGLVIFLYIWFSRFGLEVLIHKFDLVVLVGYVRFGLVCGCLPSVKLPLLQVGSSISQM